MLKKAAFIQIYSNINTVKCYCNIALQCILKCNIPVMAKLNF